MTMHDAITLRNTVVTRLIVLVVSPLPNQERKVRYVLNEFRSLTQVTFRTKRLESTLTTLTEIFTRGPEDVT